MKLFKNENTSNNEYIFNGHYLIWRTLVVGLSDILCGG